MMDEQKKVVRSDQKVYELVRDDQEVMMCGQAERAHTMSLEGRESKELDRSLGAGVEQTESARV